ncbi:MAG: ROK family protein, partial [Acidobacteria bacterium]|nr:ROK family protein [Acidobacteriota bacterium]
MRRIDPVRFQVATRGTSRSINRQIALTLVRTRQPISRADLARLMGVRRGAISLLVNELIAEGLIFEGATGETERGRKPTFLYIDSRRRSIVAVDVRVSRTFLMATDRVGRQLQGVISFPTPSSPKLLVAELTRRIKRLLTDHPELGTCQGVGVAVPGMVDWQSGRLLHAPTLDWRDVDLKTPLAAATGLAVHIENSGKACALAQMWNIGDAERASGDLVFVSVSDGVGVGVVINGEILRGQHSIAGEFGHVPINIDGP